MDKKWKIIFLIYADFTKDGTVPLDEKLERELERVFQDLLSCSIQPNVQLFVVFHSLKYLSAAEDNAVRLNNETIISEVHSNKGSNSFETICRLDNGSGGPGGRLQRSSRLTAIMKEIQAVSQQADHILLATWDHGAAFGIFADAENSIELLKPIDAHIEDFPAFNNFLKSAGVELARSTDPHWAPTGMEPVYKVGHTKFTFVDKALPELVNPILVKNLYTDHFKVSANAVNNVLTLNRTIADFHREDIEGLISEEKYAIIKAKVFNAQTQTMVADIEEPFDILTNDELAEAIQYGLGQTVDVLLMMNCWMVNVHTAYALRNTVSFLVGPQTGIDEPGYDYQRIIEQMTPATTPEGLIAICMQTFECPDRAKYGALADKIQESAILAMDLKAFEALKIADILDKVARLTLSMLQQRGLEFVIKSARRHCFVFNESKEYFLIDFVHWLHALLATGIFEFEIGVGTTMKFELSGSYQSLLRYIAKNPVPFIGPRIYNDNRRSGKITNEPPTGFTIYFPEKSDDFLQADKWLFELIRTSSFIREKENWLEAITSWDKVQQPAMATPD